MKKAFWGVIVMVGFALLIGTAGASDAGTYTLGQSIRGVCAGLLIVGIGYVELEKQK